MSEQQFHHEIMSELEWQQQKERNKIAIAEHFNEWLYKNYHIGNGDTLVRLMEDMSVVDRFLKDAGLPLDKEF